MKKEAIREAYGVELKKLGTENKNIVVLDADVSNSTRSIYFGRAFPERFFNMGIAETNMVSTAAGMAAMGKIPIVNTFSFLLCERALDQIRSSVAYNHLNVKFAANYGGLSDSYDGASHQSVSDLGIIRSIPGLSLVVISDAVCMRKALKEIINYKGPVYFRLCRAVTPIIHSDDYEFEIGKGVTIKEGKDITIIATGIMLYRALSAAYELMKKYGIDARIIEIHTLKPIDEKIIIKAAKETGAILTCEEANIYGGLFSAVSEIVAKHYPVWVDAIGIDDCFAESGDYELLLDNYGMSVENIVQKVRNLFKKNNRTKM